MPNRILKESICTSDTVDGLSWFEEVFFYRLIVNCDDYGRMDARPAILKAKLFPLKQRLPVSEITNAVKKLAGIGCVKLYEFEGRPYLYFPSWNEHQRIRNSKEKYPAPEEKELSRQVAASCGELPPRARVYENPIQSEYESNPNTNRGNSAAAEVATTRKKFVKPSLEDVKTYCRDIRSLVNPQEFYDFYESNGWMVGKNHMVDWKAAFRRWGKNTFKKVEHPERKASYDLDDFERKIDNEIYDTFGTCDQKKSPGDTG